MEKNIIFFISNHWTFKHLDLNLDPSFTLVISKSASEALQLYEEMHAHTQAVILNLSLEDGDGLELLSELKHIDCLPEVIVFSEKIGRAHV